MENISQIRILWRNVGPTIYLKTLKKLVYDNVTNHVAVKGLP